MKNAESNLRLEDNCEQVASLAPLNIIRTETVLSKLPVHNLSKKGRVDIQIVKRGSEGAVELRWEVSHSDRYGQPRQLAYKLDTLIVNRRMDEEGRPLPSLIRIGSLGEICAQLGMQLCGKNRRDIKMAFLQNATAFINAQLTYKSTDGGERTLEAGFTRYGVVFTGDKLPDGSEADAVYVTLNQPYWEVVNSAPVRPLNYDDLKELTPGAQRFYEVISYRIYAALKNGRNQARLAYSDYCMLSAQQRYYDHEHFRVQMHKIHKPHMVSGYIKAVSVEASKDGEGKPDWMLIYTPGPKARAEFVTFSSRQAEKENTKSKTPALQEPSKEHTFERTPAAIDSEEQPLQTLDPSLLQALVDRGISPRQAQRLLTSLAPGQHVVDQLEWADFQIAQARPGMFRNPPGFYVSIIRENFAVPADFETSSKRKAREEERRVRDRQEQIRHEQQAAYESYVASELQRAYEQLSAEEAQARWAAKRKVYAKQFSNLLPSTLDEVATSAVRREIQERLSVLSFREFVKKYSGPNGLKGQTVQSEGVPA